MVDGYMFYRSLLYINEYLPKVDIHMPCIWDDKYTNKFEEGVLLVKWIEKNIKGGNLNICINLGT